jgi:SSS family solute:Na+ symporter
VVIHIGVALYTAAWVLRGILGIDPAATIAGIDALMFFIIVLGVLTGIYTMIGGLLAVVLTESAQTMLLIVGAVCITIVGFIKIGGWSALSSTLAAQPHPMAGMQEAKITWNTGNFLNMMRFEGDPSGLPWYSILLGYPVLGIWYWCCDQTIVQRVLAARDEKQARLGPLFCAFIKILPVFIFVLPGVICVALVQNNYFNGEAPKVAADTYTFMITHMLPVGLKGLIAAAMLAAAMQTCSAALNSTATLFSYDIFKRWRPQTTDHQLVVIGKVTTVVATIVAIALSRLFGHYATIIEGLNKLISYIAPPITAVFLFGVFWKKASGRAAYSTLIVGAILGVITFFLDWNQHEVWLLKALQPIEPLRWFLLDFWVKNFMMTAFYLFVLCSAVVVIVSRISPEQSKEEANVLVWENWREPLRGEAQGRALGNYRVLAVVVLVTFVMLYYFFR